MAGEQGDITYPWKSPTGSTMYLRSIGVRDMSYQKGVRLVGTFQDATSVVFSEQISRHAYLKSDFLLQILADTFEAVHVIQFDKGCVMPVRAVMPLFWKESGLDIARYLGLLPSFVPPKDCEAIEKCVAQRRALDKNGNFVTRCSWNFKGSAIEKDRWYNVLISLDPNVSKDDMIIAFRDISEVENNKHAVSTLRHTSEIDGLTKVFNRTAIEQKINEHISENPDETSLVLLLDLDNFKAVNDMFGHIEGDNLLIETAEKLEHFCRSTDKVGRLGGDEFIIFLRSVKEKDIDPLVSRIIEQLRKKYSNPEDDFEVTASIGIAHYPRDGASFSELYHCADIALYDAKRRGKNRYSRYRDMSPGKNGCQPV
ncbi:GGDEF domain-containing protein [Intestinimonas aquisgranensis]|nr:GGDEF domain-containing protein [Intestinimonas aquisgranensis]